MRLSNNGNSKYPLESPVNTWVYKSCHLLTLYKVVDAILLFVGKDTIFPRNFQDFREKILEKGEEKEKIGGSQIGRAAY